MKTPKIRKTKRKKDTVILKVKSTMRTWLSIIELEYPPAFEILRNALNSAEKKDKDFMYFTLDEAEQLAISMIRMKSSDRFKKLNGHSKNALMFIFRNMNLQIKRN